MTDNIRIKSSSFVHATGMARNIHHCFQNKDRRSGVIFSVAWDLPLWAVSQIAVGNFTVEGDDVVISRLPENEVRQELTNILAVVGYKR